MFSPVHAAIAHEAAPNKLPSAKDSFATKTAIFSSSLQSLERICGRAYSVPSSAQPRAQLPYPSQDPHVFVYESNKLKI